MLAGEAAALPEAGVATGHLGSSSDCTFMSSWYSLVEENISFQVSLSRCMAPLTFTSCTDANTCAKFETCENKSIANATSFDAYDFYQVLLKEVFVGTWVVLDDGVHQVQARQLHVGLDLGNEKDLKLASST